MKNIDPSQTKAWKELQQLQADLKNIHMKDLFTEDPQRAQKFSIQWEDFYVDYSKNRINDEVRSALTQLAKECGLKAAISAYYGGEKINATEGRQVLHTALRAPKEKELLVDGENVIPLVYEAQDKMKSFSSEVIIGAKKGFTGKAFTDIVNIGIGGSDLGPVMVTEALKFYKNHLNIHYISNVDGDHVHETLKLLDP